MKGSPNRSTACPSPNYAAALLLSVGGTFVVAQQASAQSFSTMHRPADVVELRPVGISGTAGNIAIPYTRKAISEKGVQYQAAGIWKAGTFFDAPEVLGPGGEIQDVENVMFRGSPSRAQTIPGVDIIVKKTPGIKAAVWDTRESDEGVVVDLPNPFTAVSWANSLSINGGTIGGAVYGDLGTGVSRRAAVWRGFGPAALLPVPANTRNSEVFGTSEAGNLHCGAAIAEQGIQNDTPKMKPKGAHGIIWHPDGFDLIDFHIAGPDTDGLVLTAMIDDGGICMATISTTRSNAKGGVYRVATNSFTRLDGGDINQDGVIDVFDDHDSAVYGFSSNASVIGGSISIVPGQERAAVWLFDGSGAYLHHDLNSYLASLGTTGLDPTFTMNAVTGVSADGLVLTGWGTDLSGGVTGWVAMIPAPGALSLIAAGALVAARRRR